ncbi:MAG TPA: T9SS type A sorting domain-containing protein, partial [Catalimonadaceae bacterium]|nr:T9SS type A sorting domain-containing protein [Catalimonadaceae bacterium]
GAGTGYAPKLFRFAPEYGKMSYRARLTSNVIPDSVSAFGASFTADSRFIYLSVNNLGTDTGFAQRRGIFRFDTEGLSSSNLAGAKIGNVKDNHANVALVLDGYGSILVNQYHRDALDAIHQPSAPTPELHQSAIHLTTDPEKAIRSWQGLPNFVDAKRYNVVPDSGLTDTSPWRLGTNPQPCCPTPLVVNVACTGNEDSTLTTGNDIFYEVILDTINGSFKNLVVSSTLSEFPTKIQVKGYNVGSFQPLPNLSFVTNGNGQWIVINDSTTRANFPGHTARFQIIVNANSLDAVGNFKTQIFTEFPNPDDNIANCCRIAVSNNEEQPFKDNYSNGPTQQKHQSDNWKIYPNPTNNLLWIETTESGSIEIIDLFGRKVLSVINVQDKVSIPLDGLPTGIYQVKLTTSGSVLTKSVSLQK